MGTRRTRRLSAIALAVGAAGVATAAAGVSSALAAAPGAPSVAGAGDDVVTVSGLAFPDPARAQLSFVGCTDLYGRTAQALQPMIGQGPGDAPSGNRSLAFDLAGGDAVGAAFPVTSVLGTTTASVAVHADGGSATGVAWVGYQAPDDAGTGRMWLGRAALSTPGGAWQTVDATDRFYAWTQLDMTTHAVTAQGPAAAETVADFAAAHGGDGPGLYTVGFGCDGTPFNIDDFRIGSASGTTTYDLEGLTTSVTMRASGSGSGPAGGPATLRGALGTDTHDAVPAATLLLEQSDSPDGPWTPAGVVPVRNGVATTTVQPDDRTWYRWRFVDRPLASGSVSDAVSVAGSGTDGPTPSPTSRPSPTGRPSPTVGPTATATVGPTVSPTVGPTASPTVGPTATTSASPSAPSSSATGQPTPTDPPTGRPSDAPTSPPGSSGSSTPSTSPSAASAAPTAGQG